MSGWGSFTMAAGKRWMDERDAAAAKAAQADCSAYVSSATGVVAEAHTMQLWAREAAYCAIGQWLRECTTDNRSGSVFDEASVRRQMLDDAAFWRSAGAHTWLLIQDLVHTHARGLVDVSEAYRLRRFTEDLEQDQLVAHGLVLALSELPSVWQAEGCDAIARQLAAMEVEGV